MNSLLPWHQGQWEHIQTLVSTSRLPHALLIQGAPGSGKTTFSYLIAKQFLCSSTESLEACNECRSCQQFDAGTHPDFKLITLEEKAKQIKIDQIRNTIDFIQQTAQYNDGKVTLIQPAEAMNANAANALLKSLEEPAPDNLIILQTDTPSRLLPTVRSRCLALSFSLPDTAIAHEWLAASLDTAQIEPSLQAANGQPLLALKLAQSGGLDRLHKYEIDFLALLSGQITPLAIASLWSSEDLAELSHWLKAQIIKMVRSSTMKTPLPEPWAGYVKTVDLSKLLEIEVKISHFRRLLDSNNNPNIHLALEELMVETCEVFR